MKTKKSIKYNFVFPMEILSQIKDMSRKENQKKNKKTQNKRLRELEKKAIAECWQYCYENGLTEQEQEEYDYLIGNK